VVLMPPPAISKRDLERLVEIAAESIRAAVRSAYGEEPARLDERRSATGEPLTGEAAA
jgi:hypothetical protein